MKPRKKEFFRECDLKMVTCGYTDFTPNRAFTARSVGVVVLGVAVPVPFVYLCSHDAGWLT